MVWSDETKWKDESTKCLHSNINPHVRHFHKQETTFCTYTVFLNKRHVTSNSKWCVISGMFAGGREGRGTRGGGSLVNRVWVGKRERKWRLGTPKHRWEFTNVDFIDVEDVGRGVYLLTLLRGISH